MGKVIDVARGIAAARRVAWSHRGRLEATTAFGVIAKLVVTLLQMR